MDKRILETYKSNKEEIRELRQKLAVPAVDMAAKDAAPRSCYGSTSPMVWPDDLEIHRRKRWEKQLEVLQGEVEEVEMWIEAIPDGITRRCFRLYSTLL